MKNNRPFICRLQLWASCILTVFRETIIFAGKRNSIIKKGYNKKRMKKFEALWSEQGDKLVMEHVWVNLQMF